MWWISVEKLWGVYLDRTVPVRRVPGEASASTEEHLEFLRSSTQAGGGAAGEEDEEPRAEKEVQRVPKGKFSDICNTFFVTNVAMFLVVIGSFGFLYSSYRERLDAS